MHFFFFFLVLFPVQPDTSGGFKPVDFLPTDSEDTKVIKSMITALNSVKKDNWIAIAFTIIGYSVIMLYYSIKLCRYLKVKEKLCFKKASRNDPDAVHGFVRRRPVTRSQTRSQTRKQKKMEGETDSEVTENI